MPEFIVRVQGGSRVAERRVSAPDAQQVAAVLGVPQAAVLRVRALAAQPAGAGAAWRLLGRARGPLPDLRLFSQELALLLDAGVPLLDALLTLDEQGREVVGAGSGGSLARVIAALREGQSFSAALAQEPERFGELFRAIVAASERSGQLPRALRDHAAYLAWAGQLRARLAAAAVYPALLLGAGLLVLLFLFLYVLPRFATVFEGLDAQLPAASSLLIGFGAWAGAHRVEVLAAVAALGVVLAAVPRVPAWRAAASELPLVLPGLAPRWRVVLLARLYRALALLLAAGVPALAALRLLAPTLPSRLRGNLGQAAAAVEGGERLSGALDAAGLATPVARRMCRVGEDGGELAAMLERAAGFHDEQIERATELLVRAVNPLLMLVLGLVIGSVVVLMYLPIFTLMEQVQ